MSFSRSPGLWMTRKWSCCRVLAQDVRLKSGRAIRRIEARSLYILSMTGGLLSSLEHLEGAFGCIRYHSSVHHLYNT
jgi:hypothetical protein